MPSLRPGRRRPPASDTAPADAGRPEIPGYSSFEVVGHGASSTVYRAYQGAFGRTVAVKLLHVDVSDRRAQRRFEREKEINGRLSHHPNVVTVLDAGFVDGRYPYLAMELFEHGSLAAQLSQRGPFEVGEALRIGVRIAGALASAHALGILHRDVKPQNILLSRYAEPALADFGISAILELDASMTTGLTPAHAAPEILEGHDPSPASDVYALASTIYTLLSGVPPFAGPPGEGVLAQLLRITTVELPALGRDDVPVSLFAALRAATAKRPEERTPDAVAFAHALQAVERELGEGVTQIPLDVPAAPPAVVTQTRPPADRPTDPEATIDHVVVPDDPTVAARHVAPPPAARRSRRRPITIAVACAIAAAGGGTAAYLALRDPGSGSAAPPVPTVAATTVATTLAPTTTPAPAPTTAPVGLTPEQEAMAPTDLHVAIGPDEVRLTWVDNSDGADLMVETHFGDGRITQHFNTAAERTLYVPADVGPTDSVCFVVRAFLGLRPDGTPLTADSTSYCINNATTN